MSGARDPSTRRGLFAGCLDRVRGRGPDGLRRPYVRHHDGFVSLQFVRAQTQSRMVAGDPARLLIDYTRTMFAARDQFGIKPLFYATTDKGTVFASEKKSILEMADEMGLGLDLDRRAIEHYVDLQYVPEPESLHREIRRVESGCTVTIKPGGEVHSDRYFKPHFNSQPVPKGKEQDLYDRIARALEDSVEKHMRADVTVGSFLSGGIDSTAIAALMVRRGEQDMSLSATPESRERDGATVGVLGIAAGAPSFERMNPAAALWGGVANTYEVSKQTLVGVWQMITRQRGTDDLGGPLRIAQISGQAAALGLPSLITFIAVLSVNLGLINLFPIPVLDGGHLVFYAAEAIRGRPLSARAMDYGLRAGLAVLAALFIFSTWNDLSHLGVVRWITGLAG